MTSHSSAAGEQPAEVETLVKEWLTLPDVGERLGLGPARVRQLVREHQLIAIRRGERGVLCVPAAFIHEGKIVKGLPGTLTLLSDAGYDDDETLRWLYTPDESLPGAPIDALVENRGTEVKRRAQALGF